MGFHMPYITQINGATIDLNASTPVVTLPPTGVLNSFGTSTEFSSYNVLDDANSATTETGDYLAPIVGTTAIPGTYQGGVTFSTAALTLGTNPGVSVQLTVNPISGSYFIDEDGGVFIITDTPLDADNISVSGSIVTNIPPVPALTVPLVQVSLTGLLANPTVRPLIPDGTVNGLLNGVISTQTPVPGADLVLDPDEINELVCFTRDTLILTPSGYRPVQDLQVGDLVVTRDNGNKPIEWIGSRKLEANTIAVHPNFRAIRIRSGALGAGIPSADLLVSPQHRILVRSKIAIRMFDAEEVLVAAKQLLNVNGIEIADDLETFDYYHFLFDQHEIVFSNGAETESLFTGQQALKGVGKHAAAEIFALFPELQKADYQANAARPLITGRQGRKLASRHQSHEKPLVM